MGPDALLGEGVVYFGVMACVDSDVLSVRVKDCHAYGKQRIYIMMASALALFC